MRPSDPDHGIPSEHDRENPIVGALWEALVSEDDTDLDVELIAAYAEGRLDDEQRQSVKSAIAASPRAIELLQALREDVPPSVRDAALPPVRPQFGTATTAARARRSRALGPLLAAAVLLIAVGLSYRLNRELGERTRALAALETEFTAQNDRIDTLSAELAAIQTERIELLRQVADSHRQRLYALAGDRPPFLASRADPGIARLALAFRDEAPRGLDGVSPDERAAREAEIERTLDEAAEQLAQSGDDPAILLDRAALEIAGGRLQNAMRLISQAEASAGESPASLNLRAAAAMTEAMEVPPAEADRLRSDARRHLERAIELDPNYALAWFNLALLEEDLANDAAARDAWREYLARETDEALKALVRAAREIR